ncbi:hypothetical protein GCM10023405_49040 [Streptomonospora salina]
MAEQAVDEGAGLADGRSDAREIGDPLQGFIGNGIHDANPTYR